MVSIRGIFRRPSQADFSSHRSNSSSNPSGQLFGSSYRNSDISPGGYRSSSSNSSGQFFGPSSRNSDTSSSALSSIPEVPGRPPPPLPTSKLIKQTGPPPEALQRRRWSTRANPTSSDDGEVILPGERPQDRSLGQMVRKEDVRELCDLVRIRFAADVELYALQSAKAVHRSRIQAKMDRADAALAKIERILESWNRRELFESDAEWEIFQDVKTRVELPGKRNWASHPPWIKKSDRNITV